MQERGLRIGDLCRAAARRTPDKLAIIAPRARLTFAELDRDADRFAATLRSQGLGRGDVVTVWGENDPFWAVALYGAARAGCIVNPVNAMLTADELDFIRADVGSRKLVASASNIARLASSDGDEIVYAGETPPSMVQGDTGFGESVPTDAADVALICYTSGTTGRPKGATLSHRAATMNAQLTSLMHGRRDTDTVLSALPLAHVYGNVVLNASMLVGATLVLLPRFDADSMVEAMVEHRPTVIEAVPTMYHHLLASDAFRSLDHAALRICTVGGQSMPVAAMEAVQVVTGCPLLELWGMTELAGLGVTQSHLGPYRLGAIGTALPFMETRVVDRTDAGRLLPDGEAGELLIRGPLVMNGYLNQPDATRAAIDAEGWLRTGDIAVRDDDGFITILDRKSDVILSGGYNIYPAELERVLADHPAVAMVAVGTVAHPLRGEDPRAYIVLRNGHSVDERDIIVFAKRMLAPYKMPRSVRFVEDLPRTASGKIMRRALCALDGEPSENAGDET